MRALIQRVLRAEVRLTDKKPRAIGPGLLIYLGIGHGDNPETAKKLAEKCAHLRVFSREGKFARSLMDENGEALVISQFTLYGDSSRGRRPDFAAAAPPQMALALYAKFIETLTAASLRVKTGEFGAAMVVESVNDGPLTLWLDTDNL